MAQLPTAFIQPHNGHWPEIHPTAFVHPRATIIGRVKLGAGVNIWPSATLRADEGEIVIGEGTNIQDGTSVHMTGGQSDTIIGARCTIGHNVILHGCQVEDECVIGMGAILLDNCRIGTGSFIGAGTLITGHKVIPPNSLVYGNPFKIIRQTTEVEQSWIKYSWAHYQENAETHRAALLEMAQKMIDASNEEG
ncbi:MAG: gamma carbonic anhydrase family protein [Bradymonadia bacterium]